MSDFYEIDFLSVESEKSGDAIPLRYEVNGIRYIHVVDGGFNKTKESLVSHIKEYYDNPKHIDAVVVTHPDGDHVPGLNAIFENFSVGALWMLRPWMYAEELIHHFPTYSSTDRLKAKLKSLYPFIAELEETALAHNVPIYEPFQGARINHFTVLSPSKLRYLELIVNSERTPTSSEFMNENFLDKTINIIESVAKKVSFIFSNWGEELFSPNETSAENEMSVIQYANLCDHKILLTGDAGRQALTEAADYAPVAGLYLPGIDRFQVPHHGSRRNVSSEILDRWLGPRLSTPREEGQELFRSYISSSKEDTAHPRKCVIRAIIHRGGKVSLTEGKSLSFFKNVSLREGWSALPAVAYPTDQED